MLSEISSLDVLAAELVAGLRAAVPSTWTVRDAEGQVSTSLGIVLWYEQGDLVTTINGRPTGPGNVGVEFTLTLAAPETDPEKGTATVTNAVVSLLSALDAMPNLYWDRAEKVRLNTGETTYRVEVVHLCTYTTINPDQPEEA